MSLIHFEPNPHGRTMHPAADVGVHPPADAPSDRVRPVGSLSFRALRAIAAGLARVEQPLPPDVPGDGARSSRLIATAFYDVWLITWPDGSGLEPHDHGDVRSGLQIVDGELTETFSDRRSSVESAVRTLRPGSVTIAEPTVYTV